MGGDEKIQQINEHLLEIKDVLKENIEKVSQRGEQLDSLDRKSERLSEDASLFRKQSRKLKMKFCKENAKKICCLTLIMLFIIGIIILFAMTSQK